MRPLFAFVLVVCWLSPAAAQVTPAQIDSLFVAWDRPDTPGAAVAVLRGGQVIFDKGYGAANLEYNIPITPATVFLVASVSKQFTAFAIAMLADQGKLSLDDDIRRHVPEMHDFGTPITLRHLVHHTSGLRDEFDLLELAGWRMDDVITKDHILALAYRQRALNFTPGAEYVYCNTGYTLLAEVVERVTGQPFGRWLHDNVFTPLEMTHSLIQDDFQMIIPNRAQGYEKDDRPGHEGFRKQVMSYQSVGASGLHTTVGDLARWLHNFETQAVGGPAVHRQVLERGVLNDGDTLSYAFGLGHGTFKGRPRISHSGWHRGFRTVVMRFPEDDLGVIVLSNLESFDPTAKAYEVAGLYLSAAAGPAADFAGAYHSEELGATYHIEARDGHLVLRHRRNDDVVLRPAAPDYFETEAGHAYRFLRDGSTVVGLSISTSRARNMRFGKILQGDNP